MSSRRCGSSSSSTQVQDQTVKSANDAVRLTLNQYKAGTVAYTSVVTAQALALRTPRRCSPPARTGSLRVLR